MGKHRIPQRRPRSRRTARRKLAVLTVSLIAPGVGGAGVLATTTSARGEVTARFTKTADWSSGFQGTYTIRNETGRPLHGWRLQFHLPPGNTVISTWDGELADRTSTRWTIANKAWNAEIPAGGTIRVDFVGQYTGAFAAPVRCRVNGRPCDGSSPTGDPAPPATLRPVGPTERTPPTSQPSAAKLASPPAPATDFAPYLDALAWPPLDLGALVDQTGVKRFTLGFITHHQSCSPAWDGRGQLDDGFVRHQIETARKRGAEIIAGFGGPKETELAQRCGSVDSLVRQYRAVIDAYHLTRVDFFLTGNALADPAAVERRSAALARLQDDLPDLRVSFTLPAQGGGLSEPALGVLRSAVASGLEVSTVNLTPAPGGTGGTGKALIETVNKAHTQLRQIYRDDSEVNLWARMGITPVISGTFRDDDVRLVRDWARTHGLGMLSLGPVTRNGLDNQLSGLLKIFKG